MEWLTILAIVVGPLAAVVVGHRIADRSIARHQKHEILTILVAYAWDPTSPEFIKALNAINLRYHDAPEVRAKWNQLFDSFCRRDLPDDEKMALWKKEKIALAHAMAKHLGMGETLDQLDFDQIYIPGSATANLAERILRGKDRDELLTLRDLVETRLAQMGDPPVG